MNFKLSEYQNLITSLLLNGHFIQNIGLMHGKTGLALLFYQLAKQTGNTAFETFAGELVDEIVPVLSARQPVDFENGLAGIGWGMEYLVQNGFLEADTDEVLEDFDKQIFKKFLENPPANIGLLSGVLGTGYYFLMRIKGAKQKPKNIITETNRIAIQHICNHLALMLQQPGDTIKEPFKNNTPETINKIKKQDTGPVPVFEITWNLPTLIGFLTEVLELNVQQSEVIKMLTKLFTPSCPALRSPVLQNNRLLMLYSLIRLKNTLVVIPHSGRNEISILVNQTIEKTVSGLDNEKYIKELGSLNFSTRNGIPGIALIHQKLYEQTGDLKYKNEYTSLLNRFVPQDLINGFRYDYSNPLQTNEQSLGLLQGISGLLLTAVELEIQP
ncbi:MAG: lanthionine synthetase LanC family protein [Mariniphaga sp.]|jgi:hypothetical protein|nr:lanthionine synthetase LanC family protein [Mariniphaga sp.]